MVQVLLSAMPMSLSTNGLARLARLAALLLICALACGLAARAQDETSGTNQDSDQERGRFAGTYRCVELQMGDKSAPCQSPPLVLNEDGSYQIWGEEGSYELVQGRWLILEHSQRRGMGHIVNAREIIFEYSVGDKKCKVTFRRIFEPPPGYSLS
jgi:hypothetical protein